MNGTIETIKVFSAKGDPGKEVTEARLIENSGLEGDFHATGGERQISFLFTDDSKQMALQKEKGLCFSRFKGNITVSLQSGKDGQVLCAIAGGTRLYCGDAVLEITSVIKHCFEECVLFNTQQTCPLAGKSLFARVLKSGTICSGSSIKIHNY